MKLFIYGFWSGFEDKTNPVNVTFFIDLLTSVFNEKIEISNFNDSDILLETIFESKTFLFDKKWKYSFLFSGESRLNQYSRYYSCVLYGERNHGNIINVPLFIPYIYCSNLEECMIEKKHISNVPAKNMCAVISNPNGKERNTFLNKLEQQIKIDYGGEYKNNVPRFEGTYNSKTFINRVSEYKFIVSMENSIGDTYISEKIIHGFLAGVIPIYWGSSRVCDYFNNERFINVDDVNDAPNIISRINEIINDDNKFLEIVNKPIFNNNKLELSINEISCNIKSLIFKKKYEKISRIFAINSLEFEPDRHARLTQLFKNLEVDDHNVKFICPTYKQTITSEIMDKHVKYNFVKRIRHGGMKKSEISLFLNYKEVLKNIVENYSGGLFLIFESDIFIDEVNISKLNEFINDMHEKREGWDLIHIGKGGENEYFSKPYCDSMLPYRHSVHHLPNDYIEDITHVGDKFRLIRKFHTRCTDSFIWSYKGVVRFYNYLCDNFLYDAPFDYYMINFFENNVDFKHYWSLDTFFIQGSNYGLDYSSIQKDTD